MIVIGLDTASDRWHAVENPRENRVAFQSQLKGKKWANKVAKPQKPAKGSPKAEREAHAAANDLYQAGAREALDRKRERLATTFTGYLVPLLLTGESVHVFCEEPLALQNPNTTRILSLAAGAIQQGALTAVQAVGGNLTWNWIDVAHWKRVVVGKGNADKAAIREFVLSEEFPECDPALQVFWDAEEDLYDAACLWRYGQLTLTQGARPATL